MLPLTYAVIVLPRAFADLNGILTYIAQDSPQNAVSTINRLQHAMGSLRHLPHRFKVHESRKNPSLTVRSMPIGPFLVFYRVDSERPLVRIITVRHGHRRQPRRIR